MTTLDTQETVSYIAKPCDSRCQWWSAILENITIDDLKDGSKFKYLKRGADLELVPGTMLIESEANHHRNNRGYTVTLKIITKDGQVGAICPMMCRKQYIKNHGGKHLMSGSGDVAGVIRMYLWIIEQEDVFAAYEAICKCE